MADKPTAADGTYASAMPDKPLRPNLPYPGTVSVPEGSGIDISAGSIAVPEALPLIGEAGKRSTSTSTNNKTSRWTLWARSNASLSSRLRGCMISAKGRWPGDQSRWRLQCRRRRQSVDRFDTNHFRACRVLRAHACDHDAVLAAPAGRVTVYPW